MTGARAEIAIAACRVDATAGAHDLFPDADSDLLVNALETLGLESEVVSWDDPQAEWRRRCLVVVRSTWDSVDRPGEYVEWAREVGAVTKLVNSPDMLAWNLDKAYLQDLAADSVSVVPTAWIFPGQDWGLPRAEFVIKPSISAGGRETAAYGPDGLDEAGDHVRRLLGQGLTVMVQPYLASVVDPGELSLIFIDGRFSHAVGKDPLLQMGAGVQERLWERITFRGLLDPAPAQLKAARVALGSVERRFEETPAYARVDLLDDRAGQPLVLEVELIDPNLSLGLFPTAAATLGEALANRVTGQPGY
ncbi:MAG: ATP-grasp domain-containing protein [Acidimicrobiales bacterium]